MNPLRRAAEISYLVGRTVNNIRPFEDSLAIQEGLWVGLIRTNSNSILSWNAAG
jgi:hypothetical protein